MTKKDLNFYNISILMTLLGLLGFKLGLYIGRVLFEN